jgi:hypothetical protein
MYLSFHYLGSILGWKQSIVSALTSFNCNKVLGCPEILRKRAKFKKYRGRSARGISTLSRCLYILVMIHLRTAPVAQIVEYRFVRRLHSQCIGEIVEGDRPNPKYCLSICVERRKEIQIVSGCWDPSLSCNWVLAEYKSHAEGLRCLVP